MFFDLKKKNGKRVKKCSLRTRYSFVRDIMNGYRIVLFNQSYCFFNLFRTLLSDHKLDKKSLYNFLNFKSVCRAEYLDSKVQRELISLQMRMMVFLDF